MALAEVRHALILHAKTYPSLTRPLRTPSMFSREKRRNHAKSMRDCIPYCGYFFNATGGIVYNMPLENAEAYFEACRTLGSRRGAG